MSYDLWRAFFLHLYIYYGIVCPDERPNQRRSLWRMQSMVTFSPLKRGRYRVYFGNGKRGPIVKQAQIDRTRRMHENGNRKPLPKIPPIESLKVAKTYWLPDHVSCPNCYHYSWFQQFGRNSCPRCDKSFKLERVRF